MRINRLDVNNIRAGTTPLVTEALAHLDATFDYLHTPNEPAPGNQETGSLQAGTDIVSDETLVIGNGAGPADMSASPVSGDHVRTDFESDPFLHTETASRLGRTLQIFATLAAQAAWARHTEAAVLEHGEQTTAAHVLHRMNGMLARRTIQQNTLDGRGRDPFAKLYSAMITDQIAGICAMLTVIVDTAPFMTEVYTTVASTLGCSVNELEDRIKLDDEAAMRAVAHECVQWTERKWREHGGEVDAATHSTFQAMAGLAPTGPFSGEGRVSLGDSLAMLGLDPKDAKEIAPGVHVLGLRGSDAAFTPPLAGSVAESDHIRVG